ncbi:contactin-associated protein-like 5 [Hydractinia symbiolongicarpus]|uniref:contactin-associated protein-like 5 n=1 Tax=Hydractinia symbiolongicarpus TaxID=13093 RepID=UPI00254FBF4C|nr:contactin-associated protein-like 5 [Hydractinia symbiolongicarpus]
MKMYRRVFHCCVVITALRFSIADVKTFYGEKKQSYAKYKPWNATYMGTLKLKFKTQHSDGLLFYTDDHQLKKGRGNYIKLKLHNKRLELHLQLSYYLDVNNFEARTLSNKRVLGYHLNDNKYHFVEVVRIFRQTLFTLDGRTVEMTFGKNALHLNSSIYAGGVPKKQRTFVDADAIYEKRFVGCISKLRYDNGVGLDKEPSLAVAEEEQGTQTGCRDACAIQETQTCHHGGRCLNKYVETGCDCVGTGYTGHSCLQATESLQFFGSDYLVWRPRIQLNSFATEISLRFRPAQQSGILYFASSDNLQNGYMFIELYKMALILVFKTKDTKEEVVTLGDNKINQTSWRFLRIVRTGKSMSIHLDDGTSVRKYVKQSNVDDYSLPPGSLNITYVYVGGLEDPNALSMSRSQKHFTGCLQDIIISGFDLLRITRDWADYSVTRVGNIKSGCRADMFLDADFDNVSMGLPSLTTQNSNETGWETDKKERKGTSEIITSKKQKTKDGISDLTWMIIGSSCIIVLILITAAALSYRCIHKQRKVRRRSLREHYLQQVQRGDEEELPLNQRCIRAEINRCDLKTFSPVRRAFYMSPNESETLQRTDETVHRSYEAMVRNRDEIHGNHEEMLLRHKTLQHSHTKKSFDADQQTHYSVEIVHSNGKPQSLVQQHSIDESLKSENATLRRCRRL